MITIYETTIRVTRIDFLFCDVYLFRIHKNLSICKESGCVANQNKVTFTYQSIRYDWCHRSRNRWKSIVTTG